MWELWIYFIYENQTHVICARGHFANNCMILIMQFADTNAVT